MQSVVKFKHADVALYKSLLSSRGKPAAFSHGKILERANLTQARLSSGTLARLVSRPGEHRIFSILARGHFLLGEKKYPVMIRRERRRDSISKFLYDGRLF